jgi:hypothetical protein
MVNYVLRTFERGRPPTGKAPMIQDRGATFYILKTILSTKLGEFMLENLILFLIMPLCIIMRLLALGIQLISKCLKRR